MKALVVDEGAATLIVRVPVAAEALVTLIANGLGEHVTPGGRLAVGHVTLTIPVKPPVGVTVMVEVPAVPPAVDVAELPPTVKEPGAVSVNVTAAELLAVKLGSPPYCATIECVPGANVEIPAVVNASLAEFTAILLATVVVVPLNVSTKFTVPVGSRVPLGLIDAWRNNVTGAVPEVNGTKLPPAEAKTLATVVLLAGETVTLTGLETLGAKVPSPPYLAVT